MSKISLSANFLVNTSVSLDDYAVIIHTDIPILNFICRSDETVYDNSFPFPASIRLIKPEIVRFLLYQRVCTPSMWCYLVKAFSSSSTCLSWIYRHISGRQSVTAPLVRFSWLCILLKTNVVYQKASLWMPRHLSGVS